MKKIILFLFAAFIYVANSFGQTICPAPVTSFTFTINRPVTLNQKIGGAGYCEPDAGQIDTWSIDGNPTMWKILTNGDIVVNDATAINNSLLTTFTMTIRITDNGIPALSSTASVTINDINNPPVINPQTFSVAENSANGTVVGTVIATDINPNQTKTFSIISGNINGTFIINPTTGVLTVFNSPTLNYEVTPVFLLVVKVQDNGTGELSAQATITVNLLNVNEAPITVNQTF